MYNLLLLLGLLIFAVPAYAVCPPNLPLTANGSDQINAINSCAGGVGGGSPYPTGAPPQIGGFSSTNIPESETVGGDCVFIRAGAQSYTLSCGKSGGVPFGADAFLGIGTGLSNSAGLLNISPTGVIPGAYANPSITVNTQGQITAASNGSGGGGGGASIITHTLTESGGTATMLVNSATSAGIDVEYITLNANLLLTSPPATGLADGQLIIVKASEPAGGTYTTGFVAASGVALKDDVTNGSNSAVGVACSIQNSGWMVYEFQWYATTAVLELKRCSGNPSAQTVHGLAVSMSGAPPSNIAMPTVCPFTLNFPANFGTCIAGQGTCVSCGTNPSETDVYLVKRAGTQIGQLSLSSSCVATFTTTSGVPQTCTVGQRLEVDTPATVSGADIAIVFGAKAAM